MPLAIKQNRRNLIMDDIDIKLLHILSENSNQTATDIMPQINLSIPAINKRIAKMRASGLIKKFTLSVDAKMVGKPVLAYVMVILNQYSEVEELVKYIRSDKDIVECHAITGEYDYILKMYARDIEHLEEKLIKLKKQKGITKSQTMFSLLEYKNSPGPLPD